MKYSIATENDLEFISKTYNENVGSLHGVYRDIDTWKQLLLDKKSVYYIVCTQLPVAWFRIDVEEDELWLGMLQVKPAYHRQGIGSYILSIVEAIAEKEEVKKIGIHTTEDNLAARVLYLSAGYELMEIGSCTTADGKERVGYTFQKVI